MQKLGSILVRLLLVLALAAGAAWLWLHRGAEVSRMSGTIEVDEVHVASRYGGRVVKIFVNEGDLLEPGATIAELDAAELEARRQLAAAQLAELERGSRPGEIEAAKKDWESLREQLEFARAEANRAQELLKQRTVSPTESERAVSAAAAMEKNMEAARQRYEMLREGPRPERIDGARAQLAEIAAQLREMKILAPSRCLVEVLHIKVGDVLSPNREAATLVLPEHLWMRVYVPEPWLGRLHVGDPVRVRVDSWPEREFDGQIEQIARKAEFTPRNVQTVEDRIKQVFAVKVRLDNRSDALRAGMSADVEFPSSR
jgi:HlyD family secretion protein